MSRPTPRSRALVGCLALADGSTLNDAVKLAGYSVKSASPVQFYRGHCYVGAERRCLVRDGRVIKVSRNANELTHWMLRLGRKLATLNMVGSAPVRRVYEQRAEQGVRS